MKVIVNLDVSVVSGHATFDLEELGYTEESWKALSQHEKRSIIQAEVHELPDQPYWDLDSFEED